MALADSSKGGTGDQKSAAAEAAAEDDESKMTWQWRAVLVSVSVLSAFLTSGIVYGYSGLFQALAINSRAFASSCQPGESLPCSAQSQQLSAAYTLSAATSSASAIVVGIVLDSIGPRWTFSAGCLVFALGLASFAAAPPLGDLCYFAGFMLLSLGGPAMFSAAMNFGELFPTQSAAIMSAQNGAFDASSFVMFLMGQAVVDYGFSLPSVMLAYLITPFSLLLFALAFFPNRPFGTGVGGRKGRGELWRIYSLRRREVASVAIGEIEGGEEGGAERGISEEQAIVTEEDGDAEEGGAGSSSIKGGAGEEGLVVAVSEEEEGEQRSGASNGSEVDDLTRPLLSSYRSTWNEFANPPAANVDAPPDVFNTQFATQLSSPIFWVSTLVSGYFVMRSNFYIGSINEQIAFAVIQRGEASGPEEVAALSKHYIDIFNTILPLGGLVGVPLAGWMMVQLGMVCSFITLGALCALVSAIQIASVALPLQAQIIGFGAYSVGRVFIFGVTAAFIGRVFGFLNFGRLYGINRMAGAITTIAQYPLMNFVQTALNGDYYNINVGFLVVELLSAILFPIYLWKCVFYGYFIRPPIHIHE